MLVVSLDREDIEKTIQSLFMLGEQPAEILAAVRDDSLERTGALLRDFPEYANVRVKGSRLTLYPVAWPEAARRWWAT